MEGLGDELEDIKEYKRTEEGGEQQQQQQQEEQQPSAEPVVAAAAEEEAPTERWEVHGSMQDKEYFKSLGSPNIS